MKRAEIHAFNGDWTIRSYDAIPSPPSRGLVIKTSFCGICHSDLHALEDEITFSFKYPIVLGHEISGVVYSLGKDKDEESGTDLKVGDKVIIYPWTGCTECRFCKSGETNYCQNPSGSIGFSGQGGLSEYVVVCKKRYAVKVPDSIALDVAATLPCSALTGYNAVTKVKPTIEKFVSNLGDAALLVIGAGGLGLWCLQTAKALLPKETRIISADISEEKLQNALKHGADDMVLWDPKESKEKNIALAQAKGCNNRIHAVIDFVNNSATAAQGLGCLTKGGAMALVGLFGGTLAIRLPLYSWGLYQMFGVYVGSLGQLRELLNLVDRKKLISPNITHVKFEDAQATLERMRAGQVVGRAIVKY